MVRFPSGRVTFVFSDIEGSTRLLRRLGDGYGPVLERHRTIVRDVLAAHGGLEVNTEGDGFFLAFGSASHAVRFCADAQRALSVERWPDGVALRVRMGVHCGDAVPVDGDYVGLAVHQAARVAGVAHGGQVLLTADAVGQADLTDVVWARELGAYRLKDFDDPVRLFELRAAGLPDGFPALRALPAAAHNVPLILTSFVGRSAELAELRGLLRANRLVTVSGSGGAGKTRLAFELAASDAPSYPDGAWVVLLAGLEDPAGIASLVAEDVGVAHEPGRPIEDSLIDGLAGRRLLVVLDNCEHVVQAAAGLTARLLGACPGLTVLATSREPLRVAGERVWRLPSLSMPPLGPFEAAAWAELDAVRLFTERAQAIDPGFALSAATAPAVALVCRQLDGIPLAIELAAARLRHLSVHQVAERLTDRFLLLTGGGRDVLPRQRTLRATVEWSHGLLTDAEQVLFRRLSVFRSTFTLAAAEAVCADDALPDGDILDRLADLLDKSLVMLADDDDPHYRMLVTMREYAHERLEAAGELAGLRQRHCDHLRADPAVTGPVSGFAGDTPGPVDTARIRALADDLRAAFDWAVDTDDGETACELAFAWSRCMFRTARYGDGREWCERALDLSAPPRHHAWVLYTAGLLATCDGDSDAADAYGRRLLEHAAAHHFSGLIPWAHLLIGDAAFRGKGLATAQHSFRAGLQCSSTNLTVRAVLERSLGDVAGALGDRAAQEASYRDALATFTQLGSEFERARTLTSLGWLLASNDSDAAVGVLREAWQSGLTTGASGVMAVAVAGLAALAACQRRYPEAAALFAASEALAESLGTTLTISMEDYRLQDVFDSCLSATEQALGPRELATARHLGRATNAHELCDTVFPPSPAVMS